VRKYTSGASSLETVMYIQLKFIEETLTVAFKKKLKLNHIMGQGCSGGGCGNDHVHIWKVAYYCSDKNFEHN